MNIEKLDLRELLRPLPHKLQVKFALDCVNDVKHLITDPESLKALKVTALWLEDKAKYKKVAKTAFAAYYAAGNVYEAAKASCATTYTNYDYYDADYTPNYDANYATYDAYVAAANASAAFASVDTDYGAVFTACAAAYAAKALNRGIKHYRTKLLTEFLTPSEIELYYGDVK